MSLNQIFWLTHSKILSYKDPAVNFLMADLMDWLSLCSSGLNLCKPEYLATLNLHITYFYTILKNWFIKFILLFDLDEV